MLLLALPETVAQWGWYFGEQYQFWKTPLQIFAVFVVVSWVYFRIQGTYVGQLLKGVALILIFNLVANLLNLTIIGGILQAILQISVIGFIILFQPELRRLLVYLGQPDLFGRQSGSSASKEKRSTTLVHDLMESLRLLSKSKTGALIVLESPNNVGGTYLEAGTRLDARLSTELLLTLFHPNTPLHDGAVVISPDNRILAAGVLLPLSENPNLSWKYGTRHRAAIGLSEVSDSRCIVVSEETGTISTVFNGSIERLNTMDDVKHHLDELFGMGHGETRAVRRIPLADLLGAEVFQRFFAKGTQKAKNGSGDDRSAVNS